MFYCSARLSATVEEPKGHGAKQLVAMNVASGDALLVE